MRTETDSGGNERRDSPGRDLKSRRGRDSPGRGGVANTPWQRVWKCHPGEGGGRAGGEGGGGGVLMEKN